MGKYIFLITILTLSALSSSVASAQPIDRDKIVAELGKTSCTQLDERKLKFCLFDYVSGGSKVEAIAIYPLAPGKYPGLLLLPGFEGTAVTLIGVGAFFAQQGFACLA
ncbi:MAG TPA: hypothetical protein VFM63_12705 [Pyrinomonadaceae bacterium]|nr:hypothetical protein [Pyrinomonadaceae bacterium]